jgi:hypothetical protein
VVNLPVCVSQSIQKVTGEGRSRGCQWFTPVILAIREAEIRRIVVHRLPEEKKEGREEREERKEGGREGGG